MSETDTDTDHDADASTTTEDAPPEEADEATDGEGPPAALLGTDEYEFGIPDLRDPDTGDLKPAVHTYEYDGREIHIQLTPPTVADIQEYRNLGDDVDAEELAEIVDRHIVQPHIDDPSNLTARELTAYAQGILDYSSGGNELAREVNDELEARGGGPGNSPEPNDEGSS